MTGFATTGFMMTGFAMTGVAKTGFTMTGFAKFQEILPIPPKKLVNQLVLA